MSILSILLLSAIFAFANPDGTLAQMTIPTRTPVPSNPPPQPTIDNGGGNNGGGNNGGGNNDNGQQAPTATVQTVATVVPPTISVPSTNTAIPITVGSPTATGTNSAIAPIQTSTVEVPPTATQELGATIDQIAPGSTPVEFPIVATAYPTAEPCGEPPTFTTLTTANVYGGPGSDYPVRETLAADEVRPIVGRAASATWWLIQLDGKYQQAWISDKAGSVQGNTGNIPIIEAPSINGAFPTPGEDWDPTPAPVCTPSPTPTSDSAVITGSIINYSDSSSDKVNTSSAIDIAAEERIEIAEAAAPLELDVPTTSPTPNLLPIAGLVLVVAAVFVALFLRRSPGGGNTSS